MSEVDVHVVILNWNGWRDTIPCLRAVDSLMSPPATVWVVDNGSTDDSVERIQEAFPQHPIVQTGRNLGFAGGANAGIERALAVGADAVWLLNNDTVPDTASLAEMVRVLEDRRSVGVVGSLLCYAHDPDEIQALGGGRIRWWLGLPEHVCDPSRLDDVEYVVGASMLVRRDVFEEIGMFDEAFFLYWEDADFSRRARAAGWELAVAPESVVLHKEGGTASAGARRNSLFMDVEHLRSLSRFMRKHHPLWLLPLVTRALLEVPNQIRYGTPTRLPAMWRGLIEGAFSDRGTHGPDPPGSSLQSNPPGPPRGPSPDDL